MRSVEKKKKKTGEKNTHVLPARLRASVANSPPLERKSGLLKGGDVSSPMGAYAWRMFADIRPRKR